MEKNNKISKKKIKAKNINRNNNPDYLLNISKILRKKIDIYNKTIYKLEKKKEKEKINANIKMNKASKINKQKINKPKHFKSGSMCENENKSGNMIYINFNINNNTNNNIIGNENNFNNFIISDKNQNLKDTSNNGNIQTERIKYILQNKFYDDYPTQNENHLNNTNTNNNSLFLGLNGVTFSNINSDFSTFQSKIIQKKQANIKIKRKNNFILIKNLSKHYTINLNTSKNNISNISKLNIPQRNKKNLSLNKSRHTFSRSYGKNDFNKIFTKKMKETVNNTVSVNNEMSYRANCKKLNKIPCGRISQRIPKREYNLNHLNNKETLTLNSKQRMESTDEYNINKNIEKNNNIEIKYSIQEILNTERNNLNIKKLNYVYSKKSMLERKHNQFNFPISKSNSYRKSNRHSYTKNNLTKSKGKGSQLNIIPQMAKIKKILKFQGEEISKNENISFRNSLNKFNQEGIVEKIKVNKNIYIN